MKLETRKASDQPSVADAIIVDNPLPPAPEKPAQVVDDLPAKKPPHVHPSGVCDRIVGEDRDGKPIIREVPARTPTYVFNCKACQWEDRERMKAPTEVLDLDSVLFLVPESDYDQKVCRAYVSKRYPEVTSVTDKFHAERLSFVPNARVVVVTRRAKPGKQLGPRFKRKKDAEDVWQEWEVEPETYLDDVVESAPINIRECLHVQPAGMFSDQKLDLSELIARLSEVAYPYRIAIPAHPDDRMYVMRNNT